MRNIFVAAVVFLLALVALALWTTSYETSTSQRLAARLVSPDRDTRDKAAEQLMSAPELSAQLMPVLIDSLKEEDSEILLKVIIALNQIGSPAVKTLLNAMMHQSVSVRAGALQAVGRPHWFYDRVFAPTDDVQLLSGVIRCLSDSEPVVRARAAESLFWVSVNANRIPTAVQALGQLLLGDSDGEVRKAGIRSLGFIARDCREKEALLPAVSPLRKMLGVKHPDARVEAARSFAAFGPAAQEAIPDLVSASLDSEEEMRNTVINSLKELSFAKERIVVSLIDKMGHGNADRRVKALTALRWLSPLSANAIPILVSSLQENNREVQRLALVVLGEMGPSAKDAVGAIRAAIKVSPLDLKVAAAIALWKIEKKDTNLVQIFRSGLTHPFPEVRMESAAALGEILPAAKQVIPDLERLIATDESEFVRNSAKAAIHRIRQSH